MQKESQTAPCYKVKLPNGKTKYVTPTYLVMNDYKIPYGKGKHYKPRIFKPAPMSKCQAKLAILADRLDVKGFYKEANELDNKIKSLQEIIDIQNSDGNWNYDPYMFGLANGLIMSMSIMDDEDLDFLDAPKKWLSKKEASVVRRNKDYGEGLYQNMDKYKSIRDYFKERKQIKAQCLHKNTIQIVSHGFPMEYCNDCKELIDNNKRNRGDWSRDYFDVNVSPYNDIGFFDAMPIDKIDYS